MHFGTYGPPFQENQLDLGAVHFCARHNSSAQGMQLSLEAGAAVGRGALTHLAVWPSVILNQTCSKSSSLG